MRHGTYVIPGTLLAFCALGAGAAAQTETAAAAQVAEGSADSSVSLLTLDQAIDIATGSNPLYRQELNTLELSGSARQRIVGDFLPSVSISAATAQGFERQSVGIDDFGRPIPNPDVRTTYRSSSNQGLSFDWTLFDGLQRFQQLKEQEAQVRAWQGSANTRLAQVVADVERAFFRAQLLRDRVALEEEVLRVSNRVLEATERLFALAAQSRADVLGARVDVQRQDQALESARRDYLKELLALRRHMGDPAIGEFELQDAPLDVFDPATLDLQDLLSRADESSPQILQSEATVALNRASASRERGTRWPTLSFSGGVGRYGWGLDQDALFDVTPTEQTSGSLSLGLSWNIFDGFDRQYAIASADVESRNASESLRETRLATEQEVRGGLIDLEAAFTNLETALSARESAEERLRLQSEEYLLAASTFLELQQVVSQAAAAARDALQARYEFIDARITLEQSIGARITGAGAGSSGTH
jgi:outer membrane protein